MELLAIISLISAVMALVRTGALGFIEIKEVLAKYEDLPATPENVEAMRVELLARAKVGHAVDDPRIRAILEAEGINPDSLRIE